MLATAVNRLAASGIALILAGGLFSVAANAEEVEPPPAATTVEPTTPAEPPATVEPAPVEPPVTEGPPVTEPAASDEPTADEPTAEPEPVEPTAAEPEPDESTAAEPAPDESTAAEVLESVAGVAAVLDLRIQVGNFPDTSRYVVGYPLPIGVRVINGGVRDASGVHLTAGPELDVADSDWGVFAEGGPGGVVPAGREMYFSVTGVITELIRYGDPTITASVPGDANPADNTALISLNMILDGTGTFEGHVYADGDRDGSYDADEGLAGIGVDLLVPPATEPGPGLTDTTDAAGRFLITGVPVRMYQASFRNVPPGLVLPRGGRYAVDGTGERSTNLEVRAVAPLSAMMDFVGTDFHVGDVARLELRLYNSSAVDMVGIRAVCPHLARHPQLELGPTWDSLLNGPGLDVAAEQARDFNMDGTVPAQAAEVGRVEVACSFGTAAGPPSAASTAARVLGRVVNSQGLVYADTDGDGLFDNGEGLAGVTVSLINPDDAQTVVATAVTDSVGLVWFAGQYAGYYLVQLSAPWEVADPEAMVQLGRPCAVVICRREWTVLAQRSPGSPPPSTSPPPPPQGGDLPATGAGVAGLPIVGLSMVVMGVWLVLLGRRRVTRHVRG